MNHFEECSVEELREIKQLLKEFLMTAGLVALQQAVTDLTAAVTAASAALGNTGDSDAAVAALATEVETQTAALKAATPAPSSAA